MAEIQGLIETVNELTKEVRDLKKVLAQQPVKTNGSSRLLSSREVISRLGLQKDNKTWRRIREILITEYGMSAIPPLGVRIPEKNLEKFLRDHFT